MIKKIIKKIYYMLIPKIAKLDKKIDVVQCGTEYGGFRVVPKYLSKNPVVYSFGIGEDISFDKAIINDYNAEVFAFDPTPKSINWVKKQKVSLKFHFFPYGLSDKDGIEQFYLPKNTEFVSGSAVKMKNLKNESIDVQMKKFDTITKELKHKYIDVLKMDIEGKEYDVMHDIINSSVEIKQICIEVHGRLIKDGNKKTKELIELLHKKGYSIVDISDNQEELTFVKESK